MKLKYYLRGLGIGILITTIILSIAHSGYETELTDEEIIQRAKELGMVMEEDPLFSSENKTQDSEITTENTEIIADAETTESTQEPENTKTTGDSESTMNSEDVTDTERETDWAEGGQESETSEELEPETETAVTETYHLVIPAGAVPRTISNELAENGVIEDASEFRSYLAEIGYAKSIKVGEYDIPYGATYEEIYQILKEGPIRR